MIKLFEGMSEIFEIDIEKVTPELSLGDVEWDSVAIISTIALVDEVYGIFLDGDVLANCKNVKEIIKVIEETLGKDVS